MRTLKDLTGIINDLVPKELKYLKLVKNKEISNYVINGI